MPPLPAYANVLKVRLRWSVGADVSVSTTFHFAWSGTAPTDADCVTMATDIYGFAVTHLIPACGTETYLTGCDVTDLTSATAGYGEHLASTEGTQGGNVLPANACALVNFGILRRYRGGKPRVYLPFGTYSDVLTPQTWQPTSITSWETLLGEWFADINGVLSVGGCLVGSTVSISYYEGFTAVTNPITGRTRDVPKVRAVAIAPDVIAGLSINPKIASQRRRLLHSV